MAVAENQDRRIFRAQDAILPFTLADENGSAYTWEYTVRKGSDATATLTITGAAITATYDAGTGDTTIEVTLTAAQTDIAPLAYRHALWRTNAGNTYPYAVGQLTVAPSSHDL